MERLETPVTVALRHPRTGEMEEIPFSREMAAYAIRLLSYSQETASLVPLLLSSAARSDLAPLAAQFLIVTARVGETNEVRIRSSAARTSPSSTRRRSRSATGTPPQNPQTDGKLVCPLWPRAKSPRRQTRDPGSGALSG
jgi:hypothetical protein